MDGCAFGLKKEPAPRRPLGRAANVDDGGCGARAWPDLPVWVEQPETQGAKYARHAGIETGYRVYGIQKWEMY